MIKPQLNILLVDDDSDHVRMVRLSLQRASQTNFQLHDVNSLATAIDYVADHKPDAILLDLGLPDSQGLAGLAQLHERRAAVPIVVLTGSPEDSLAVEAVDQGAQDFLRKDELTTRTLERVLCHAVGRQQMVSQLQAANELLDQKNRRLAQLYETAHQFVDHVSHEFRTPLTVIKEFVSIMHDGLAGQVNEQQREFLEIVNDRTDDLANIVDDMLDVSKLEAGLLRMWRRKTSVRDILEHVRPMLERKAVIKKVALEVDLEDDLPVLFCDPEKIGRVIVNLAVNAIKFCGENGTVKLWACSAEDDSEVVMGVADNGPGIERDDLRLIFDRFHQVAGASRGSTKGFGLGLSIAKELVQISLGQIDVRSDLGEGSTFSFTVPTWNPLKLVERCLQRLARRQQKESVPGHVSLIEAAVRPDVEPGAANVVDEFLQHTFGDTDLVIQARAHRWLVVARCHQREVDRMIDRLRSAWNESTQNRPGGLLPDIDFAAKGTWDVPGEVEKVLRQFSDEWDDVTLSYGAPKVLVVEDDRETLRGLEIRLRSLGYEVLAARDGRTAVDTAAMRRPDAILIDNYMPGLDGVDVLTQLQERESTADIPVIMVSASLRDQREALQRGARFFLQKPCDIGTISAALKEALEESTPVGASP